MYLNHFRRDIRAMRETYQKSKIMIVFLDGESPNKLFSSVLNNIHRKRLELTGRALWLVTRDWDYFIRSNIKAGRADKGTYAFVDEEFQRVELFPE